MNETTITPVPPATLEQVAESLQRVRTAVAERVVGQEAVIDEALVAFLARGHALLEGVPGVAKTLMVRALAGALGGRPLRPRPRARVERRSPLEHVGALAQAYERVGATRLATRRLVHGVKRRHAGAAARIDDEELLRQIAARHPEVAGDVARLLDGTRRQLSAADFVHVGTAVDHIERTLKQ